MGLNEIREKFLLFFEEKGHLRQKSASLVPENDNSLLLISAGMVPLKTYFTEIETPPSKRMTTCQKCIRTVDIDNVGITPRHGTFFEMLGNFSFGDYFKEEAIKWAWEFIIEKLELPLNRLFVSVFEEDNEAFSIWENKVGLPKDKIFKLGRDDNFWEVGTTGPCGPSSEIFFDMGEEYGCKKENCAVGCDCDRFMEVWNLVFIELNKEENGSYSPLPNKNIDTGMGLERISLVMQNVSSIFDIDTFKAIRDEVSLISKTEYGKDSHKDLSIRIVTDHMRSVTFMLADGVLPNNEGRGYVLRRLLRRAIRHGRLLGIQDKFLENLCKVVIGEFKGAYPELLEKQDYILRLVNIEESRFLETLEAGTAMIAEKIAKIKELHLKEMTGEEAFKLYDTYGFPVELLKEMLGEEHIEIDEYGFEQEMLKQRELARSSRSEHGYMGADDTVFNKLDPNEHTEFIGYTSLSLDSATIKHIILDNEIVDFAESGAEVSIILDKTPFYAEAGGQAGDSGIIKTGSGMIEVVDCVKVVGNKHVHRGKIVDGSIKVDQLAIAEVDKKTRQATERNHTATHILQKALRDLLGNHIEQAGSNVTPSRLRFDFTHFEALTPQEIKQIEEIVNEKIYDALCIEIFETSMDEAKEMGAMALFGEKYADTVRVVKACDYATELCGGTHVKNTSQIGVFKILSENGIAAGVRRIEAITGQNVIEYYNMREEMLLKLREIFKANPENFVEKAQSYIEQVKGLKGELDKLKQNLSGNIIDEAIENVATQIKGVNTIAVRIDNQDNQALRTMGDQVKDKLGSGVIVLMGAYDGAVSIVSMATDDVVKKGIHAGNIIKEIAPLVDGRGGGKPTMAQAGGKNIEGIDKALEKAKEVIEGMIC